MSASDMHRAAIIRLARRPMPWKMQKWTTKIKEKKNDQ